jgi:hypothetical protein
MSMSAVGIVQGAIQTPLIYVGVVVLFFVVRINVIVIRLSLPLIVFILSTLFP